MEKLARITGPTVEVLRILRRSQTAMWGLLLIKETGRTPGTIYPILGRLEALGWVRSRWEQDDARPGPRRRYFELTEMGDTGAQAAIASFEARRRTVATRLLDAHQ